MSTKKFKEAYTYLTVLAAALAGALALYLVLAALFGVSPV